MQVTETINNGLKREYNVTVDASVIGNKVEERLLALSKKIKMPGFRPGKVPLTLVKKNYNDSVSTEVLEEVVTQSTKEVLEGKKLRPALQPKIKVVSFNEGAPLEFTLSLELFPEVTMPDFSKVTLEKLVVDVQDKDIDDGIARLTDANKEFEKPAKAQAAKDGNAVVIDFEGKLDGVPFEGGKANGFRLVLGSGQFINGFEAQLVGSKEGEKRVVKVTFPSNYGSSNLAGKDAEFDVTVHEVLVAKTPEANDEFAKKLGLENLEALRIAIKERIQKDFESAAHTRLKKELFDELDKSCTYDVPEGMVENEFQALWSQALEEQKQNPDYFEGSEEDAKKEYQKMSARRVRLGILLAEIGKQNGLTAGQDELRQAIYEQARQFQGQEHKVIEFYRKNPEALEQLKGPILEDKAVAFILEKVTLKEKVLPAAKMLELLESADS
jgi:trigger factor